MTNAQVEVTESLEEVVDAIMTPSAVDVVSAALGKLNPASSLMAGRIRINGDPILVQKLLGHSQPSTEKPTDMHSIRAQTLRDMRG